MKQVEGAALLSGSRKVEPVRRRKKSPSDSRRKETRAAQRAAQTVAKIHATAQERQDAWGEGGLADFTDALTRNLVGLYGDLRTERREAYASGDMPEGTPYRGRTAGPR